MFATMMAAGGTARMIAAVIGLTKILVLFGAAAWAINDYQAGVYSRAEQRWDAEADRERLALANARLIVLDEVTAANERMKATLLEVAAKPIPQPDSQLCPPGCIIPSHLLDGEPEEK